MPAYGSLLKHSSALDQVVNLDRAVVTSTALSTGLPFCLPSRSTGPDLSDGPDLALESTNTTGNTTFLQGPILNELLGTTNGSTKRYYYLDGLGSVLTITDATGAVVRSTLYSAYGMTRQASGSVANPVDFTGAPFETEPGFHFMRERYFDSRVGSWLTQDPIRIAGGPNLYAYVSNNPVNRVDPFGLMSRLPRIERLPPDHPLRYLDPLELLLALIQLWHSPLPDVFGEAMNQSGHPEIGVAIDVGRLVDPHDEFPTRFIGVVAAPLGAEIGGCFYPPPLGPIIGVVFIGGGITSVADGMIDRVVPWIIGPVPGPIERWDDAWDQPKRQFLR